MNMHSRSAFWSILLSLLLISGMPDARAQIGTPGPRLTWLGTADGNWSIAYDVSAFGHIVVGYYQQVEGLSVQNIRLFRWTKSDGMETAILPDRTGRARGLSHDGTTFVGSALLTLTQAFRWHPDNPDQDQNGQPDVLPLETPGYNSGEARAVSSDGGVIVGAVYNWSLLGGASPREAFRWTETDGLQLLGTLGGEASLAENVSADGAIVVGSAQNQFGKYHAFRWTAADGMQPLGTLMYVLYDSSTATAVSDDGSVVVGWAHVPGNDVLVAFRVDNGVLSELAGPTAYPQTQAYDVTADGSMVVGVMFNENGERRAFRWTDGVGLEDLSAVYADLLTPVGSYLRTAQAISPNGRYIVGQGFNAATGRFEAFLLDTWQTTAADATPMLPTAAELLPPAPNPFTRATTITLRLPVAQPVRLEVIDLQGRSVRTLIDGWLPEGTHRVRFESRSLAPGLYLCRLQATSGPTYRTLLLLR
ncbi:HAF repeat-containing protein [Rhodothermus marinus]|uniref:Extracellular repeat protein, HAF family n=1 Tax=Rhodothermus marinus (strain ATCC 43812 / DSM 4252 / R-10) TaxID=518766 RepID=D0MGN4_RHOM4|nr:HAF repeat-containing protein [Rhodothermus marinus]ACY49597.1 extracellular repeat protein, HAF family [Rhodothermus marinus DSM 4252]